MHVTPSHHQRSEAFLVNETRKNTLAEHGRVLRNPLRQAFGTMFHRLPGSYIFAFPSPRIVAITNLFVFEPLDILWLDTNGNVLAIRERLPPFALHAMPLVKAAVVIELPAGTILKTRTRVGDRVACTDKTVFIRA